VAEPETGSIELHVLPASSPPVAEAPPARSRSTADLQMLSSQAGRALITARRLHQPGTDLAWAWMHLGAADIGRTIASQLGAGHMDLELKAIFNQPWDVLEVTAMSLGFGETMCAIDLCADAVLLAGGEEPLATGKFYDLGTLQRRRAKLVASPAVRAWIDQLLAHPDLAVLKDCRDHLTHRTPRRHITMALGSNGVPTGRALAEITTLHGEDGARWKGSIADLVPRLVGFGEDQLESLCRAILAPASSQ
jgi:hypothetical protein